MTNTIFTLFLILFSALAYGETADSSINESPDASNADSVGVSEQPVAVIPRQNAESIYESQRRILEQQYPKDDILELSANGEKFIGLWERDKSGAPVGTVLILHGEGQTANWPHTIDTLRADLIQHGWSTLSISLKDPITASPPERSMPAKTSINENDTATANESLPASEPGEAQPEKQIEETKKQDTAKKMTSDQGDDKPGVTPQELEIRMQNRIKAAVSHLNDEGQFNIVFVSHGISAQRAAKYIQSVSESSGKTKPRRNVAARPAIRQNNVNERTVRAVIFINARNRLSDTQPSLVDLLDMGEMPVLDLYSDMHFLDRTESKKRVKAARDNGMKQYVQIKFLPPTTDTFEDENRLTRRVRGFLSKHAKGVEIGVK